jgi:hypothetical protein
VPAGPLPYARTPKRVTAVHRNFQRLFAVTIAPLGVVLHTPRAEAWNSATHRGITLLAVEALPAGSLKSAFGDRLAELQFRSVEPDRLREIYGKVEGRRHYIDLELYGRRDPLSKLDPDASEMIDRFGIRKFKRAGTLPWTIEKVADDLGQALRNQNCTEVITLAGHLSHYIGDASQPLHTTIHFEGYAGDEHMHERLEETVDRQIGSIERQAHPLVRVASIDSIWPVVIAELRESHALLPNVVAADRAARAEATSPRGFDAALMSQERGLIVNQIANAASVLASVWLFEWKSAGSPSVCSAPNQ